MGQKQIKIRDFGEKVRYLISARGSVKLCEDFSGALPKEVPPFTSSEAFAKQLKVNPSYISRDWSDDKNRRSESRLAPKLEHVQDVARLFGIWPREAQEERNILLFWSTNWKSWYFGDAEEQFTKQYVRSNKGDGRPDSLDAFRKAYCEALDLYIRDPEASPLYFPVIDPKELRDRAARDLAEVIRKAPQVLTHLQQHGGMEELPVQLQEGVDDAAVTIAVEWLLKAPIDIVISACQQAYSQQRGQTQPITVALLELAERLVPALYKAHAVSRIRSALGKEIGGLVELQVHHRTVAEVVVAAAEARATAYLPRRKGENWPVGARSFIDHAPDSGFDADSLSS